MSESRSLGGLGWNRLKAQIPVYSKAMGLDLQYASRMSDGLPRVGKRNPENWAQPERIEVSWQL